MSRSRRPRDESEESFQPPAFRPHVSTQAATQVATQVVTQQKSPTKQVRLITPGEEETYFDLTPYTFAPFVLTKNDAERLQSNIPLVREKELSVPEWTSTDSEFSFGEHSFVKETVVAKNRNGYVLSGHMDGNECVAKILYLNNMQELHPIIQEVLIQAILQEITEQNRRLPENCTKIPRLLAFGRTTTHMCTAGSEIVRQESPIPAAIIVMEKIQHDLLSYVRQEHVDNGLRSNICAAALQQVASLLLILSPYHFMHADLKMNNVTFNTTEEQGKIIPVTFLIDFGMASLDYNEFRIGAGMIFRSIRFQTPSFHNPYTDLTYLAWSMWRFQQCDPQVLVDCPAFTTLFSKIVQRILHASGIPFGSDRRFDKISMDTFHAMLTAGLGGPVQTTYTKSSLLRPTAITPAQIKHYAELYMKSVGSERHGTEAGEQLLRILERP